MTTGIEFLKPPVKRKGRGPSEKPALFCTSLRISKEVMDYFNNHYPFTKQATMRRALTEFVDRQKLENKKT
jgi:hypothetical protein